MKSPVLKKGVKKNTTIAISRKKSVPLVTPSSVMRSIEKLTPRKAQSRYSDLSNALDEDLTPPTPPLTALNGGARGLKRIIVNLETKQTSK